MILSDSHKFDCGKEDSRISKEQKRVFLETLVVSDEDVHRIASYPQRSPEWHHERRFRVTASNAGAILGVNPYKKPLNLVGDMLWGSKFFGCEATQYGTDREPLIHDVVEMDMMQEYFQVDKHPESKTWLESCGLIVSKRYPYFGVSPDDIILHWYGGTRQLAVGLAEYKAPFAKDKAFYPVIPEYYRAQIAMQTVLSEQYLRWLYGETRNVILTQDSCQWTKFCVFTPHATRIDHFPHDPAYWNVLLACLKSFYMKDLLPRFIWKQRGLLREGEIDIEQVVRIGSQNTLQQFMRDD